MKQQNKTSANRGQGTSSRYIDSNKPLSSSTIRKIQEAELHKIQMAFDRGFEENKKEFIDEIEELQSKIKELEEIISRKGEATKQQIKSIIVAHDKELIKEIEKREKEIQSQIDGQTYYIEKVEMNNKNKPIEATLMLKMISIEGERRGLEKAKQIILDSVEKVEE